MSYMAPRVPDRCWDAVRTCPEDSDQEILNLCEKGPVNYMNITSVGRVYRNQFCALCNGVNMETADQPKFEDLQQNSLNFWWQKNKLKRYYQYNNTEITLLTILKPTLFEEDAISLSPRFSNFIDGDISCSFFADSKHSFCDDKTYDSSKTSSIKESNETLMEDSQPVWILGSMNCFSNYKKVCGLYLTAQSGSDCTKPGCGAGKVLDPHTLQCIDLSKYDIYRHDVIEFNDVQWHSHSICSYQSRCRAVELGLLKEHELNCFCDKLCIYYNDCCEDSAYQATKKTKLPEGTFACLPDSSELKSGATAADKYLWGIMFINRCPNDFIDLKTRRLCEETGNQKNLSLVFLPVTDPTTGLRYVLFVVIKTSESESN